jgi:hypothetical protein
LPEARLNSWHPRRPSAGLKRRIFSTAAKSSTLAARWIWGALTPTMACLLLTLTALNFSNGGLPQKPALSLVLSNKGRVFNSNDDGQMAQNHLATVTFDWTNHGGFNSSMGFTPTTNSSN